MTINKKTLSTALQVLDAIYEFWVVHKYAPSYRDLATSTGLALQTVTNRIKDLQDGGYIEKQDGVGNTIRPVGLQIRLPMMPRASLFEAAGLVMEKEVSSSP